MPHQHLQAGPPGKALRRSPVLHILLGQVSPACDGWLASLMKSHMQAFPPTYTNWWSLSVIWPCWEDILCLKHHSNICNRSFWNLTHEPSNTESALTSKAHDQWCSTYWPGFFMHVQAAYLDMQSEKCHRWALSIQLSGEGLVRAPMKHNHAGTMRFKTNIQPHLIDWNQHSQCSRRTPAFGHSLTTSWVSDKN